MMLSKICRRLAAVPLLAAAGLAVAFAGTASAAAMATTGTATGITATAAVLNGTVTSDTAPATTTWQFEFGLSPTTMQLVGTPQDVTGMNVPVSAPVTVLKPSTVYDFQLVATSSATGQVFGGVVQFTTAAADMATPAATPSMTPSATVSPSATATGASTVAGCTDALVSFARTHGTTMTDAVAFSEARVLAQCQGLTTAQVEQAGLAAVAILNGATVPATRCPSRCGTTSWPGW